MDNEEMQDAKRRQKRDYLRQCGEPEGKSSFEQQIYIGWKKEREEKKRVNKLLKQYETPDGLNEKEFEQFYYLRACLCLGIKPTGDFEGDAAICADVMRNGGDILEMHRSGANAVYCSCLSSHGLDAEVQKEIIDQHVPF